MLELELQEQVRKRLLFLFGWMLCLVKDLVEQLHRADSCCGAGWKLLVSLDVDLYSLFLLNLLNYPFAQLWTLRVLNTNLLVKRRCANLHLSS